MEKLVRRKGNHKGLSLVELLVAITILAIIIVPLLRGFVSSAKLNQKSKRMLKATMVAENIMEDFEDLSIEELEASFGTPDATGVYQFTLQDGNLSEYDAAEYKAVVTLDPTSSYEAMNQMSVANLTAITNQNSGIYAMNPTYDASVYDTFAERNTAARATDSSYVVCNADFFKQQLHRSIRLTLTKGSQVTDEQGNLIDQARVVLTIEYSYLNNASTKALLPTDTKYTITRELFDNSSTKKELTGIYLVYTPRYEACNPLLGASAKKDLIEILNFTNLKTNVSIIRQETDQDATYLENYLTHERASVIVYENPAWVGPYTAATIASVTVQTNLLHKNTTTGHFERRMELFYSNPTGTNRVSADIAEAILHVKTATGETLDQQAEENRIYQMKVEIYHSSDTTEPLATLEGTKLNQK